MSYIKTDTLKVNNINFIDSKYKNLRCLNIDNVYDLNDSEGQTFTNNKLYLCNKTAGNFTKNYIYEYKDNTLSTTGIIPEDGLICKVNSSKKIYIYSDNEWVNISVGSSDITTYHNGIYNEGG